MADENKPETSKKTVNVLCVLGMHDYDIIEVSFTFGDSGPIEKLQCKRCGLVISRIAKE